MRKSKQKSKRLVPLTVMVTPAQFNWISERAAFNEGGNFSMGSIVRKLIEKGMALHNGFETVADLERKPSTAKGEKE
jgi:hypothetical protein